MWSVLNITLNSAGLHLTILNFIEMRMNEFFYGVFAPYFADALVNASFTKLALYIYEDISKTASPEQPAVFWQ